MPLAMVLIVSSETPAARASLAWAENSYCERISRAVAMMTVSFKDSGIVNS